MTLARPSSLPKDPVDLGEVAEKAAKALSLNAQTQGIELVVDVEEDLPPILGDEARLNQAVTNLILNAIEATPEGGRIEVRVQRAADEDIAVEEVVLTVWNSGSYIPPEEQERIFEPFYTNKSTGTGLGLAVCHTIVDEHGGRIAVHSSQDHGTAFVLRFPVVRRRFSQRVSAK